MIDLRERTSRKETNPANMTSPAAEPHPQTPANGDPRTVKVINSRDNVTILLLLVIAIFSPSVPFFSISPVDHDAQPNSAQSL